MRRTTFFGAMGLAGAVVAGAMSGCGGSSVASVVPATRAYLGTQAPGDVWDWTISSGTFMATNETTGFTYTGTEAPLPTGFMKLAITATTDPGVTVGQAAYAVEIPGTALVIKPAGDDANPPIVACSLGKNPAGPVCKFNWINIPKRGWAATDDAYGTAIFNVTGNSYDGTSNRFAIDGTALGPNPVVMTGDNGRMTMPNGPGGATVTAAMTPAGVAVFDFGSGQGGVIGVKQAAANVDLADLASHTYKGLLINQGKTQCVSATSNGDGTMHGQGYALGGGVETGTSDNGSGVTITFTGQPAPGEVRISLTTSGGTETLVACINQVGGKYILFGFGEGSDTLPYNFLLVQQ